MVEIGERKTIDTGKCPKREEGKKCRKDRLSANRRPGGPLLGPIQRSSIRKLRGEKKRVLQTKRTEKKDEKGITAQMIGGLGGNEGPGESGKTSRIRGKKKEWWVIAGGTRGKIGGNEPPASKKKKRVCHHQK